MLTSSKLNSCLNKRTSLFPVNRGGDWSKQTVIRYYDGVQKQPSYKNLISGFMIILNTVTQGKTGKFNNHIPVKTATCALASPARIGYSSLELSLRCRVPQGAHQGEFTWSCQQVFQQSRNRQMAALQRTGTLVMFMRL
jgi:hypothetical protein